MYSTELDLVGPYVLFKMIIFLIIWVTARLLTSVLWHLITYFLIFSCGKFTVLLLSLFLFWWVFMLHIYRQQSCSISAFILINLEDKFLQFPILKMFPSLPVSWKSLFVTQLVLFYLTYRQFILVDVSKGSCLEKGRIHHLNKKILLPFFWVPLVDANGGLIDLITSPLLSLSTLWFTVEICLFPAIWLHFWLDFICLVLLLYS